jgi:hypothetical protein
VKIAEGAGVLTMRGTAFFVLGLISRSSHGLRVLRELGWDSAIDQNGVYLGFCLPTDYRKLFLVSFWSCVSLVCNANLATRSPSLVIIRRPNVLHKTSLRRRLLIQMRQMTRYSS